MTLCFTDVETRETFRRLKEFRFTYGNTIGAPSPDELPGLLRNLIEKEAKRKYWHKRSPQIKHRRSFVMYIFKVCFWENLTSETTFLAIYLFDRFADRHDICPRQLVYVTMASIVLAGKIVESDYMVPKFKRLTRYIPKYRSETFKLLGEIEAFILISFDFDILVPTEITFLQYFLMFAADGMISADMETFDNNNNNNNGVIHAQYMEFVVKAVIDSDSLQPQDRVKGTLELEVIQKTAFLLLQDLMCYEPTNDFCPSCIAASVLMFARREHGVNFWTSKLFAVTSYNLEQIQNCLTSFIEPRVPGDRYKNTFTPPAYVDTVLEVHLIIEH